MRIKLTSFFALFYFSSTVFADLRIVTTTEDLASLVRVLGGEHVTVSAIVRGTQDPHFIEAKPSFLVTLSRADLLIAVGLSLEVGWLPLLQRGARHPIVLPGGTGFLDVSQAITPIEVLDKAERSDGDVHPEGNPHYMADPEQGLKVAQRIIVKLKELDSAHAADYGANFIKFELEFRKKMENWKSRLTKYKGTKVFGYHKSFNYFFDAFGFKAIAYLEPKPGIQPSAQHILKLIEMAKFEKPKLIVMEDYFDMKAGRSLSEKTGIPLIAIPAYTGGVEGAKEYVDWLEILVSQFETGLKN